MAIRIELSELPARLGEAIAAARAGDEVVVTDGDNPPLRLVSDGPAATVERKPFVLGLHMGAFEMSDDFDAPLPDDFWFGKDR